ncbi:MAG: T9SS type A sorting domain-containing protein [Bacteroidota bacterium]|nr:T9SS type A sorting domain-containing protein [Bacteroidota bacterium]
MGGQVGAELGGQSEWEFGGQVGGIIQSINNNDWKEAKENIYSTQEIFAGKVNNRSGISIELNPGFIADPLANQGLIYYKAFIHACIGPNNSSIPFRQAEFIFANELIDEQNKNFIQDWEFVVLPNPSVQLIEIKFTGVEDKVRVKIYDMLGNVLFNDKINTLNHQININDWNSGILVVECQYKGLIKRQKILKL